MTFLAKDLFNDQQVVLKAFQHDKSSDISKSEQLCRFRRECEIHLHIKHSGIVSALESFEVDEIPYLVLTYKPYPSLRKFIDRKYPISILQCVDIAQQLCRAIHYLHDQGIIHRDVKPENILFHEKENKIFLTDFGCARKVFAPNITQTKMIQGTLNYMSPEQLLGRDDIDFRTDIFSIGVILYQLLTYELPFKGGNPTEIVQSLLYNDPISLRQINPLVPVAMESIIHQALQKDPDYRLPTAQKCEQELQLLLMEPAIYYSQAQWALAHQDIQESAREYCLLALQRDKKHLPSLQLLAEIYQTQSVPDWEKARQCYEQLIEQQPGSADIYFRLGKIAYEQNDQELSLKMYERAWVLNPEERHYEIHVAYALHALSRHEEATEHYKALIARYPEWSEPAHQLGRLYYLIDRKQQALHYFKLGHELNKTDTDLLYNLGSLLQELGHYNEALVVYKRHQPNCPKLQHNLAALYYHLDELESARKLLEEIIKEHKWERSYMLLGFIYTRMARHKDAMEAYKHVIACNPNNLVAYLHLASSYRYQLRLNEAIDTLEYVASKEIGMHHAPVYFLLARAYNDQGREIEAVASLERCLRCEDITIGMIEQVKKDIASLKTRHKKETQWLSIRPFRTRINKHESHRVV